jgi:hypothetical protein
VLDENDRLHAEVERLRLLLRQHGVEPDDGAPAPPEYLR